jgi:C4-dicarboxylate transporter DctM subunit
MPVVIIGGMVAGVVTPTEAGVLAVLYAAVGGFFVYRELRISHLPQMFRETVVISATIMIIMAVASIFGWILADLEVPKKVADFFLGINKTNTSFFFSSTFFFSL